MRGQVCSRPPALRRHVRGRKPPRILLWSICSVTCFLFMGSAALLTVGCLNPFGSIGLAILGIGAVLFFGTILFLVMICLWVERKYPGVQTMSIKIPSIRPQRPKSVLTNSNQCGVAPTLPSDTSYTIDNDLPHDALHVPRKRVTFTSADTDPEKQPIADGIQDTEKNTEIPSSTLNLNDEVGNQRIKSADNKGQSPAQVQMKSQDVKHYGNNKSNASATEDKPNSRQGSSVMKQQQNKKTHHVEVPFDDHSTSNSSTTASPSKKQIATDKNEQKYMDKGTSQVTHEQDSSSTKHNTRAYTDAASANSLILQKLEARKKAEKRVITQKRDFVPEPKVQGKPEQEKNAIKSSLSIRDQKQIVELEAFHDTNQNKGTVLTNSTPPLPTKKSKAVSHHNQDNKQVSALKNKDTVISQNHSINSPKERFSIHKEEAERERLSKHKNLQKNIFSDASTNQGESLVSERRRTEHKKDQMPQTTDPTVGNKDGSHKKHDFNIKHQSSASNSKESPAPSSLNMPCTSPNKNDKEQGPHVSNQRSHYIPDQEKSTRPSSPIKRIEIPEKPKRVRQNQTWSHLDQTNVLQKERTDKLQHPSISQSSEFSSSPASTKKHQKRQTVQKETLGTLPTRDYYSDSETSNSRKLQHSTSMQRSSRSRDSSPAVSKESVYKNSEKDPKTAIQRHDMS